MKYKRVKTEYVKERRPINSLSIIGIDNERIIALIIDKICKTPIGFFFITRQTTTPKKGEKGYYEGAERVFVNGGYAQKEVTENKA